MWDELSKRHMGGRYGLLACYRKCMQTPHLFKIYSKWEPEEDERLALLCSMLLWAENSDIENVGDENEILEQSCNDSNVVLTKQDSRLKILSALGTWQRELFQCGMRWNYYVKFIEEKRLETNADWSKEEVTNKSLHVYYTL